MNFKNIILCTAFALTHALSSHAETSGDIYLQHCGSCHGQNRLGISGPALFKDGFDRKTTIENISDIIKNGRPSTQMPAFSKKLSDSQIEQLAQYIFTPLSDEQLNWDIKNIESSRRVYSHTPEESQLPKATDPLNLLTVVEIEDHHISIVDGDSLKTLKRLSTQRGVHGGAKYSPDGQYMYLSSRDGWVEKFDMHAMKRIAQVRAAINARNIAVSSDGRYILVGNYYPKNFVLLDSKDLRPIKIFPATSNDHLASRVSAVYNAPPRNSFIIALKDIKEIWELSYLGDPSKNALRKIPIEQAMENFTFNQDYTVLMGTAHQNTIGEVLNLDTGKLLSKLNIEGMPHLGSGITFTYKNERVLAAPNMSKGLISIISLKDWRTIKTIKTKGPGFFMRSHETSPYIWADVFFGPNKDLIHVIDKKTLKIIKTLRPSPNKTAAHIEFDRHGKYAFVSIWEDDGALVVYNAKNLTEIKRIPMRKPSGKYNVYNKINFSEGTSH